MSLIKRLVVLALLSLPAAAIAQSVRVNGTVVNERLEPIRGATVRLTGADSSITTGPAGTFLFEGIFPSGMILTVSAPGYDFRSIPLSPGNTTLTVTMKSGITTLDKMIVRPKGVRIKGQVVDEKTGDALLFARVSIFPEGKTVVASNVGDFRFDSIQGTVTIVAEAIEHLPVQLQLNPSRDTTIKLRMPIDSVAIRMISQQVVRLSKRSQSTPLPIKQFGNKDIQREARGTVGELIDRLNLSRPGRYARNLQSADEACVFYDDRKIAPGVLDAMYPEVIERVEIYRRGAMIRVYSKAYVMSLVGQQLLRGIKYIQMPNGTVVCD